MRHSELVEALRSRRGDRTLRRLAPLVGVHLSTLSKWETGDRTPGVDDLAVWAEALDMRLVVELAHVDEVATEAEIVGSVARLPDDRQATVLKLAQLLVDASPEVAARIGGLLDGFSAGLSADRNKKRA